MEKYISEFLINLRKNKNLTQEEFGYLVGMSRSKISSLEIQRRDISVCGALVICNYFNICLDCFLNPQNINCKKVLDMFEFCLKSDHITYQEKYNMIKEVNNYIEKFEKFLLFESK